MDTLFLSVRTSITIDYHGTSDPDVTVVPIGTRHHQRSLEGGMVEHAPPSHPVRDAQPRRQALSEAIRCQARELGFDLVGIAPAVTPRGVTHLREWLERGCAGEMSYMYRHADAREHPCHVLDGVQSIVMVAMNYKATEPADPGPLQGRVSRYAWGQDYHRVLRDRLEDLRRYVREQAPQCRARTVVDTAPLLEREFAQLAGLGWIGKNTVLINKHQGSWLFLGALLLDLELEYDQPHEADHCGTCTRCLEACPTDAFLGPYQLDSRRCISYLTIELRSAIPEPLRSELGEWVFGCDICQEVCPWNRKAPASHEPGFAHRAELNPVDLGWLLSLTPAEFGRQLRDSALSRPKRAGLLRNAAIVLGNQKDPQAVPILAEALSDTEPLVRGAAAWALGQVGTPEAVRAIEERSGHEDNPDVQNELFAALAVTRSLDSTTSHVAH